MINIYTLEAAREKILRRDMALEPDVPQGLLDSLERMFGEKITPDSAVTRILHDIRKNGDAGLRSWVSKIEGSAPDQWQVDPAEITAALDRIPTDLREALEFAAGRIRDFHSRQPLPNWTTTDMGGIIGQRVTPIGRVGCYVPGGTAPLPSSLLMSVVPAQVAGVQDIIVATPLDKQTGRVPDVMLAAAAITGIDTIYTLGGAQAVGALAFGTETISAVDKIVGPGGLFTTLAKRQVYGIVGIDGLYGPTETVVVADDSAEANWVAADMLAQAEHDVLATAILFTPSRALAEAVQVEIARQMEELSRSDILAVSLARQSGIVITADMAEACALANEFAAEHTCIASAEPEQWISHIPNAGGLFIGERSFEVLGDYVAGPSHTMPTSGTARFASPLNVFDFVKISSIIQLDDATSALLSPIAARIAQAEGLDGHASAALKRAN